MTYEDYLQTVYYDPRHPGSFSGLDKLYRAIRKEGKYVLGRAKIRKWLEKQETFTLHRQIIRKFKRRKVVVPYQNYQWDADTAVMTTYAKENDGYAYFLLVIDIFSRFVWTVATKTRKGTEMETALNSVFEQGKIPLKLRTDKGTEFCNRDVKKLLKVKGVEHFVVQNESKANYAERAIKTIKSRISRYMTRNQTHRWIDILTTTTQSYNETYHRSIKKAPKHVNKGDEAYLWKLQYETLPKEKRTRNLQPSTRYKYMIRDKVRLSFLRQAFDREYDERWTSEYFLIRKRGVKEGIPYYELVDMTDDPIKGTFYESELNKVTVTDDTVYRIEKILRKRNDQALVKWMGWPAKFNSWLAQASLENYKRT
jgi:hypothetical protein